MLCSELEEQRELCCVVSCKKVDSDVMYGVGRRETAMLCRDL
jgi:hypothetical protein